MHPHVGLLKEALVWGHSSWLAVRRWDVLGSLRCDLEELCFSFSSVSLISGCYDLSSFPSAKTLCSAFLGPSLVWTENMRQNEPFFFKLWAWGIVSQWTEKWLRHQMNERGSEWKQNVESEWGRRDQTERRGKGEGGNGAYNDARDMWNESNWKI